MFFVCMYGDGGGVMVEVVLGGLMVVGGGGGINGGDLVVVAIGIKYGPIHTRYFGMCIPYTGSLHIAISTRCIFPPYGKNAGSYNSQRR